MHICFKLPWWHWKYTHIKNDDVFKIFSVSKISELAVLLVSTLFTCSIDETVVEYYFPYIVILRRDNSYLSNPTFVQTDAGAAST